MQGKRYHTICWRQQNGHSGFWVSAWSQRLHADSLCSLGDKALFNLDTALLKRKLGAPNSRPLADFLPTLNIKAKDFAAEMTSVNVQQKDLHGQQSICQEHVDNNKAVRNMMLQRGIVPEDLPAGEDVKKVERRLKSDEKTLTKKNSKKK